MYGRFSATLAAVIILCGASDAAAQHHRFVRVGDWTYEYVHRLQRRGHLLELHPTALPYTEGEVARALRGVDADALTSVEARWVKLLRRALRPTDAVTTFGGAAEVGAAAVNSDRRSTLRFTDEASPTLQLGPARLFPEVALSTLLERGPVVARLGLQFDLYYRDQPDGLDAANRLISRNESYLGYDGSFVSAYLGRFDQHWGISGESSTMLSGNAAPFDRLSFRIGGRRLALRSTLGELDSITADGRFTGTAGADSVAASERRYVAAHRFDWRPSPFLALTLTEANLFSGTSAGASLRYLNPLQLHALLVDGPPKNDENNGLLGGMLWAQYRRLTLQGQLMIDDIDLLSEQAEPAALALTGTVVYAAPGARLDLGARFNLISARAYNTHQTEGQYVYLLRGIATQFSDYVEAAAFADVYLDDVLEGLVVTPEATLLAQGQLDLREPYPEDEDPLVLGGTTERTVRIGAHLFYQRHPRFWLRADLGLNLITNDRFVEGADETRFAALLSFGMRLSRYRPMDLDW